MLRVLLGLHFVLWTCLGFAAELEGIVTDVHDGDTITLVNWQHTYRIRLTDIDAPELAQLFGKDSRAPLFHMCALKRATAETAGEDRFGRTLARVTCVGVDANAEQGRGCISARRFAGTAVFTDAGMG